MKHVIKKGFKPKEHSRSSSLAYGMSVLPKIKDGRSQKSNDAGDECALSFPDLRLTSKAKMPCMTSILSRSKEESINMADLNQLQEELETMLSSIVIRKINLNNEIEILNNMEDKKGSLPISNKTNQIKKSDDKALLKISKPIKDSRMQNGTHKNKLKTSSIGCIDSEGMSEVDGITNVLAKMNDTANKFWAYVEQFCGEISQEDVKLLKDLIENCEKEAQGRKIPPLGKHYSLTWTDEDITDERDVTKVKKKPDSASTATPTDVKENKDFMKKAERICQKERIPGPLAQRIISAILEESPMYSSLTSFPENGNKIKVNDEMEPALKKIKLENISTDPVVADSKGGENTVPNFIKKIPLLHSSLCFERNARNTLEGIGFFDPQSANQEENDEILAEIKKCQEELKHTALKNMAFHRKLLKKAEAELARGPLRREMKLVDAEIVEIHKKIAETKLKKKVVGEKVKKQAWKLLKDREQLQKQMDALSPQLSA